MLLQQPARLPDRLHSRTTGGSASVPPPATLVHAPLRTGSAAEGTSKQRNLASGQYILGAAFRPDISIRAVAAEPAQQQKKISFAHCQRLEDFVQILQPIVDAGKAPKVLLPAFVDLYTNYSNAILNSGLQTATQKNVSSVMGAIADRVLHEFVEPYKFPVVHKRLLDPYDYYAFGQNYVRNLINFRHSFVGSVER